MQQAEGRAGKWIAGALKPIYLIDVWTWSVGLTSGANSKLDFFFPVQTMLLCHQCLSSLYHLRQRNHLVSRYYELHNRECGTSPETKHHRGWYERIKAEQENRDNRRGLFGLWMIDGMAKEMVWKRMLRQAVNWPGIDLILCTLLIWPCHSEIEKPKWMWGYVHSPEHTTLISPQWT